MKNWWIGSQVVHHLCIILSVSFLISEISCQQQPANQPNRNEQGPRHLCFDLTARFSSIEYADGVRKEVITINNQFPGPTIRAKLGDHVTVRVNNQLIDSQGVHHDTSVHYHGIEMKDTPWWDGPELVTQCPIKTNGYMEYTFNIHQVGTYWYHSHTSWQYIDGFWGFFIVDGNLTTNAVHRYDDELDIAITDWHWRTGAQLTEVFRMPNNPNITTGPLVPGRTPVPDSALINGRGDANCTRARAQGFSCNDNFAAQASVFGVEPGLTYRIRVLNPSARASFNFSIDGHRLRAIEVDGVDTVATDPVDVVEIWPAQRYSFLVTMDSRENTDYFRIRADMIIHVGALNQGEIDQIRSIQPIAAIRYVWANPNPPASPECPIPPRPAVDPSLAHVSVGNGTQGRPSCRRVPWEDDVVNWAKDRYETSSVAAVAPQCLQITENRDAAQIIIHSQCIPPNSSSRRANPVLLDQRQCQPVHAPCELDQVPETNDYEVTLTAEFETDAQGNNRWFFSDISYDTEEARLPAIFHLLERSQVPSRFSPQRVPLTKNIQVIINNLNGGAHPYHLHGHTFWVLATGEEGEGAYNAARDSWKLNTTHPIKRDTTHTHPWSWTVVRFCADNPGAWLLHCHIHWHLDRGLGAVFVEGDEEARCRYTVPREARRVCEDSGFRVAPPQTDNCPDPNYNRTGFAVNNGLGVGQQQQPQQFSFGTPQNIQQVPGRDYQFVGQGIQEFPIQIVNQVLNQHDSSRNTPPQNQFTFQQRAPANQNQFVSQRQPLFQTPNQLVSQAIPNQFAGQQQTLPPQQQQQAQFLSQVAPPQEQQQAQFLSQVAPPQEQQQARFVSPPPPQRQTTFSQPQSVPVVDQFLREVTPSIQTQAQAQFRGGGGGGGGSFSNIGSLLSRGPGGEFRIPQSLAQQQQQQQQRQQGFYDSFDALRVLDS